MIVLSSQVSKFVTCISFFYYIYNRNTGLYKAAISASTVLDGYLFSRHWTYASEIFRYRSKNECLHHLNINRTSRLDIQKGLPN